MTCKSDDDNNVVANRHLPQIENGYPNKGWHCAVKRHHVTEPKAVGKQVATDHTRTNRPPHTYIADTLSCQLRQYFDSSAVTGPSADYKAN